MCGYSMRRWGRVLVVSTWVLAATAFSVHADDITWTGDGDGVSFGDPLNWSPPVVPDEFDAAFFGPVGGVVDFDISPVNQRVVVNATVSFELLGQSYTLLGALPASVEVGGALNVSGGDISNAGNADLNGPVTVSDSTWENVSSVTVTVSLDLSQSFWRDDSALIAAGATATVLDSNWESNGRLDVNGALDLLLQTYVASGGADIGAGGAVTLGGQSYWTIDGYLNLRGGGDCDLPDIFTLLDISEGGSVSAESCSVGEGGGPALLTIQSGGSLTLTEPFASTMIADTPGSCVTVTVDGKGSRWFNAGELLVGFPGTASFNVSNGGRAESIAAIIAENPGSEGNVTVTGGNSEWEILGSVRVGPGGLGSLDVENGGFVNCAEASIGEEGGPGSGSVTVTGEESDLDVLGLIDVAAGELIITDGGFVFCQEGVIGFEEAGSSVVVTGVGPVTQEPSTWINTLSLDVGLFGPGSLDVTEGGFVMSGTGILGLFGGSSGTVNVDGAGSSWLNVSDLYVGELGSGLLVISNGGSVSSTAGFVSGFAGSDGTAILTGPGSTWTNLASLAIGNFGTGSLTVSDGGTVAAPQITISNTGEAHGDGVLAGNVSNSGVAGPGLSIGTLTVQGDYEQDASGRLEIELNDLGNDVLAVADYAVVAGTLDIALIDGFIPELGQEFTIVTST
ncbi:MAG: hypothetical protein ACYTG0_40595, partial [Planctomycetota bacterium]